MKTKQEQTKQMLKILCDKFQCSAIDKSYMAKSCRQCEDIVEALHEAGYGDVSKYETEREMLGSQIKVLKQRLNNKYVEIERLKEETSDIRKDTAKEILQTLCDECYEINDETGESMGNFVSDDDILCLAKHYGVEVDV